MKNQVQTPRKPAIVSRKNHTVLRNIVARDAAERLLTIGAHVLSDTELLTLLLGHTSRRNCLGESTRLLETYGSIRALLVADLEDLTAKGVSTEVVHHATSDT